MGVTVDLMMQQNMVAELQPLNQAELKETKDGIKYLVIKPD